MTTISLTDIEAARERIAPFVRRTPIMRALPTRHAAADTSQLWLKLECLQITGSFKARGAVSKLKSLPREAVERGIVTASSGNHAKGVAYAGWLAEKPARIFLPEGTPRAKLDALARWNAEATVTGKVWDEANAAALDLAERQGSAYFHPFADPVVIAGQGTIGLEILDDLPAVETVVVAIGGGGLIAGVALAVRALRPNVRIVGVEPFGAPTLRESLRAGKVVELDRIETIVGTLAARKSEAINFDIVASAVDDIVLVSDDEMRLAARWLWQEMQIPAELSGSAAMAALLTGRVRTGTDERVCAIVCGAGTDGL